MRPAVTVDTSELDLAGAGEHRRGVARDGAAVLEVAGAGEVERTGSADALLDGDRAGAGEEHLRFAADRLDFGVAGAGEVDVETALDGASFEVAGARERGGHGARSLDVGVRGAAHVERQDAVGGATDTDQTVEATEAQRHPRRNGHDQEDLAFLVDLTAVDDEHVAATTGNVAAAGDDGAAAHDHGVAADHVAAEDAASEDVVLATGRAAGRRTAGLEGQPAGDRHVATTRVDGELVEHLGVAVALDLDVLGPRVDGHGHLAEDVVERDAGDAPGTRVTVDHEAGLHERDVAGLCEIASVLDEQAGLGHVFTPSELEDGCIFCCECTLKQKLQMTFNLYNIYVLRSTILNIYLFCSV